MSRRIPLPILAVIAAMVLLVPVAIAGGNGCERGATVCEGTNGPDKLTTGNTDDIIHGGGGNDRLNAQGGDDQLFGDDGDDTLHAGTGDDRAEGGPGRDIILGDETGAGGKDIIDGGSGNDVIHGGDGTGDIHRGGPGTTRSTTRRGTARPRATYSRAAA